MDSFFIRYRNALVLVVILLAQTIGLAIQVRRPVESGAADSNQVTLVRYWAVSTVTPLERFLLTIGHAVRGAWDNYVDLRHVRQQNHDLQQQLGQLRLQQAAIAEDALQGQRLQSLLAFQQHYVDATVAAQVIGTSGSDFSRVLYIDKGSADGLKTDMAVITPDGIVGKLRDVFPHTSQVLEINDATSGAGVILASTRVRAILHGNSSGRTVITNLTPDARIKPGEVVLSSGGDQVYPRGLNVGTIESVAPDPDHQPYTLIQVRPAANLTQLEEVLIITGTRPNLTADAQRNLVKGAEMTAAARAAAEKAAADAAAQAALDKAAAEARSAAEIVGDRLPSLHEPGDPVTPAPAAGVPLAKAGGVVPKPLPTLHPDRYTPGSTPSASQLTPGAARPRDADTDGANAADLPSISVQNTVKKTQKTAPKPPAATPDPPQVQ